MYSISFYPASQKLVYPIRKSRIPVEIVLNNFAYFNENFVDKEIVDNYTYWLKHKSSKDVVIDLCDTELGPSGIDLLGWIDWCRELVLWEDKDVFAPMPEKFKSCHSNITLKIVADSGQNLFDESPDRVNEPIFDFLDNEKRKWVVLMLY